MSTTTKIAVTEDRKMLEVAVTAGDRLLKSVDLLNKGNAVRVEEIIRMIRR